MYPIINSIGNKLITRFLRRFAYMINENFRIIIAVQFTASTLVLCSNMYQLAKSSLNAAYVPLILYTSCIFLQILIYCWYGNEVRLKVLTKHIII